MTDPRENKNYDPSDPYWDDNLNEDEFIPCDKCDGHPACEDFGFAFELGLGRMVKNFHQNDNL